MQIKKKRGRPKGSKNKPKTSEQPKKKRGRPKGSKNKPKIEQVPRKRGRPRKTTETSIKFANFEGVSLVKRIPGPKSDTHRWAASFGTELIGYFKTPEDASKAYQDVNRKTDSEKRRKSKKKN